MTQDEIIEMARQARLHRNQHNLASNPVQYRFSYDGTEEALIAFAKLVAAKEREFYMQLFLDPENQPTQFGTATQEYREQEIAEVRDLLFALAHRIRTTHLYGMEVQKMLEQAEAIRARGEA